jgi:hypothetical protein
MLCSKGSIFCSGRDLQVTFLAMVPTTRSKCVQWQFGKCPEANLQQIAVTGISRSMWTQVWSGRYPVAIKEVCGSKSSGFGAVQEI